MESRDVYGLVQADEVPHLRQRLEMGGLDDDHLLVHPVSPGRYRLHDELLARDTTMARRGLFVGMAVGALLGLVVALLVGGISGLDQTLVTMSIVAGFGGLVGGMAGLSRADSFDDDPVRYAEVSEDDGLALIEVHSEHWQRRAHRIMSRHGVVFLDEPTPV